MTSNLSETPLFHFREGSVAIPETSSEVGSLAAVGSETSRGTPKERLGVRSLTKVLDPDAEE